MEDHYTGVAAGARSDVPMPRARTPSPMRTCLEQAHRPQSLARDFSIEPSQIDVVYAEDEEVFRETAIRELLKVGYSRSNIYEADNGLGALEHLARLQHEGNVTKPLLVLLDVRMPGMDGRECALQIQELVKKKALRREPFVVCISSIHRQVVVDEGKGNFQVVLPKPINTQFLDECWDLLTKWWTLGLGRQLPAWKQFDTKDIDLLAADEEPVCRLSSSTAFIQAGVLAESAMEADDEEQLLQELQQAQAGDPKRPLVILLGKEAWAASIRSFVDALKGENQLRREPFVVCTSVDSDRIGTSTAVDNFHAFLPRMFTHADVKWCLEFCRLWWLTRGDGPQADNASEASEDGGQLSAEEED